MIRTLYIKPSTKMIWLRVYKPYLQITLNNPQKIQYNHHQMTKKERVLRNQRGELYGKPSSQTSSIRRSLRKTKFKINKQRKTLKSIVEM